MKKKNKNLKHIIGIGLIVVIAITTVIFATGFSYMFFVINPQKAITQLSLDKIEAEKENMNYIDGKIDKCLDNAVSSYNDRWKTSCEAYGINKKEDGSCSLPSELADSYDEGLKSDRQECLMRYK